MGWNGITDGADRVNVGANGGLDVNIQDPTSPLVLLPLSNVSNETLLTAEVTDIDAYSFTVAVTTGFIDEAFIGLNDPLTGNFWFGHQVGAPVGNVISVDRPLSQVFPIGANAHAGSHNLNIDGSVTPQIFSLRPVGQDIDVSIDVTRLMLTMITATAADLTTFGDITGGLTKGITLRHRNGITYNVFNVKTNADIAGLSYDMNIYASTNPNQGVDGVTSRMTFSKMGAVIRVGQNEDLEIIINDDLRTLTEFHVVAEGSVVTDN
jgi:hypothetical protein